MEPANIKESAGNNLSISESPVVEKRGVSILKRLIYFRPASRDMAFFMLSSISILKRLIYFRPIPEFFHKNGYTLLEVMVALMIIGISITAVTGSLSTTTGLSAKADHAVDAVRILKNILNNPEMMKEIAENKTFKKDLVDEEEGWVCQAEVFPLILNSGDINIYLDVDDDSLDDEDDQLRGEVDGEEIEVPGILSATICVARTGGITERSYCIEHWIKDEVTIVEKAPIVKEQ